MVKKLIHVSCTSAYKYPERPVYLLVRGKKYPVSDIIYQAKIQSARPPFHNVHFYKVALESGEIADIEYHEKTMEWYLLNPEILEEFPGEDNENR